MYAVFVDGSRQYRVAEGDVVKVDYRDVEPGQSVEFGRVILVKPDGGAAQLGVPTVEGFRVVGELVEQTSTKYSIQHFRRRKNYRRLTGHRQPYSLVRVKHLLAAGQKPPTAPSTTS
jgi:large subunit ribosomal protein L21